MEFFVTKADDGYGGIIYNLKPAGYIGLAGLMILALLIAAAETQKEAKSNTKVGVHQLTYSAMAVALATVVAMIPMPRMPMGGYITLFSMLIIALVGYWFGPAGGIACGVAYGILQMIIDPFIISLPQLLCDYIFAYGALGLSGFFPKEKYGSPIPGYLVAVAGRYFFAVLSGVVFFGMYAPTEGIFSHVWLYSLAYNFMYIGTEAMLSIILLRVKAVRDGIQTVGRMAVE